MGTVHSTAKRSHSATYYSALNSLTLTPASPPSSATLLVPYNPDLYQDRTCLPLPVGWTTASKSPTSFTLFPKLPTELRLMIWNSVPEPRKIELGWTRNWKGIQWRSPTAQPITLSICQESRNEALKTYQTFFTEFDRNIYLNLSIDALIYSVYWLEPWGANSRDALEIRKLIVPIVPPFQQYMLLNNNGWPFMFWIESTSGILGGFDLAPVFSKFPRLTELEISLSWPSRLQRKWNAMRSEERCIINGALNSAVDSLEFHQQQNPTWIPPILKITDSDNPKVNYSSADGPLQDCHFDKRGISHVYSSLDARLW